MNSITDIWEQLADKYGSRIALKDETTGYSISFSELNKNINTVAQILNSLNLEADCKIALCMKPHPLWHVIDQAIMKNNFISVLCDYTSNYLEVKHFIDSMQIKILFTDNIKLIDSFLKYDSLSYIFYVNTSNTIFYNNNKNLKIYNLIEEINKIKDKTIVQKEHLSNTMVSITFSSGTTGESKAVIFTHEKLLLYFYDFETISHYFKQTCVSILSLSHIGPRLNEWGLLSKGNTIIYTSYINYFEVLKKYKPCYLICVPKLLNMIIEKYKKECLKTSKIFKILNNIFFNISYEYYKLKYSKSNIFNLISYFLYPLKFLGYKYFIKDVVNKFMNSESSIIVFGSTINKDIEKTVSVMGLKLIILYGMTETSIVSCTSTQYERPYSVGKINKSMDVIISDLKTDTKLGYNEIGMIKVKGKQIMNGYYNNEKDTKRAFDKEGYIITGDLGYITDNGFLYFVGRCKNIIVLNNGEHIDSMKIEQICSKSDFVQQIVVFGQDKPYLTAIIVLNKEYIHKWLQKKQIDISTQYGKDLLKKAVMVEINDLIGKDSLFRWTEQIRDVALIDEPFTIDNGLMTKKYTIIKNKVYNKYKDLIEKMYY